MKFIRYNIGIIAICVLMFRMSYKEYTIPKEPGENMYLFYLVMGVILLLSLIMIYFKHYYKKA
jgi:hypothetical protein